MASHIKPTNRESPFSLEELFFSTTDRKGFIQYGNNVFIRVSHYGADELVGQPHNKIRHPDMPRCVFRLLWETILKGKPIAAYVKNMAKDGSYYWVMAYVAPIKDGFLSIRMKPSGPLFERVRGVYEELAAVEKEADDAGLSRVQSMDAATKKLEAILGSLGIADYERLMHEMLVSEVLSRKKLLHRTEVPPETHEYGHDELSLRRRHCGQLAEHVYRLNASLRSFLELEKHLGENIAFTTSFANTLHRLTLNGRILAVALGEQASVLSEVARLMNDVSSEVAEAGGALSRTMTSVMRSLKTAAAEIASSDISVEMMSLFLKELQAEGADISMMKHNIDDLSSVIAERLRTTCECTEKAAADLHAMENMLDHFMNTIQTLDILYVSGRIECMRINATDFSSLLAETVAAAAEARERGGKLSTLEHFQI